MKYLLPAETVNFIERQIILHDSKISHHRYAVADKMMALSIFYQRRKAYKLLSKLFVAKFEEHIFPGFNDCFCSFESKDRYNG